MEEIVDDNRSARDFVESVLKVYRKNRLSLWFHVGSSAELGWITSKASFRLDQDADYFSFTTHSLSTTPSLNVDLLKGLTKV